MTSSTASMARLHSISKCKGHIPLKILPFDNPLNRNNKIGWPNQSGVTFNASVSFNLNQCSICIHNLDEKKCQNNSNYQNCKKMA